MKLVYIAGPFTPTARQRTLIAECRPGSVHASIVKQNCIRDNIESATDLALRVADSGHMPVCPHTNTGHPDFLKLKTPEFWYAGTLELLRRCDAIALTDNWQESNGACREVIEAMVKRMSVWVNGKVADIDWPQREGLLVSAGDALHSRGQEP